MTINNPINCIDNIRIDIKRQDLEKSPQENVTIWIPNHLATIDLNEMTVVYDIEPDKKYKLVQGSVSQRQRGDFQLMTDRN